MKGVLPDASEMTASSQNTEIFSLVIADLESVPFGVVKARPDEFV